ncbi:MAG: hypothetical protein ABI165_06790 [Bryobacteraceae bacterium]
MTLTRIAAALVVFGISAMAAQPPLPELRVEPTGGGSILYVKNVSNQPLTAFLIELVDYPGSSFAHSEDLIGADAIAPGAEKRFPVTSMTVGAVPEYVKVRAAIYADGSSAGLPEKIAQLVERRRVRLQTTRELIRRLQKARDAGTSKPELLADLKQLTESMRRPTDGVATMLIANAAHRLETETLDNVLTRLEDSERALAQSKPAL